MNRSGIRWLLITIGIIAAVSAVCLIFWFSRGQSPEESLVVQQTVPPAATLTPTPTLTPTVTPTSTFTPTVMPTPTLTPTVTPTPTPMLTPTPTPTRIPAPPGATIGFCYRVQLGETIYSLAQKFETSRYAINLANDLFPPDLVYAYQTLFIPKELGHGPNVYIFQQGDTLTSIAEQCHLPTSMIAGVNKLGPDITLQDGDAIIIPIPPFPPPARFNYPTGLLPLIPYPPTCCDVFPPYRPGPPLRN